MVPAMARPKGFLLSPSAFRAILDAKGLTQKDIADRTGKTAQTISGLYRQDHRASAPMAQAIATAVGCEAEALFPELTGRFVETSTVGSAA